VYKVFFVDDEASMRAGIRNSVDWENSNFILAGEAPDGEMALSHMQDILPDILITDVRMPFMDGLELSERAKLAMPWIKIIILSGHDEFEYAKQAIAIGVEDYLLKPITSAMLMETLNKVAARIEEEKKEFKHVQAMIEGEKSIKAERLISDLLFGGIDPDLATAAAKDLSCPIDANCYLVMYIEFHRSSDEGYDVLNDACECALGILGGLETVLSLRQGADRLICVLKGRDDRSLEEEAYALAQVVKQEVERNRPCLAAIALGNVVFDIRDWPNSLADADVSRQYMNLTKRSQIISVRDVRADNLIPFSELDKLPTTDKLRYASKADISKLVAAHLDNASYTSFVYANYVIMDILLSASKIIEELGGSTQKVLAEYSDINRLLEAFSEAEKMNTLLTAIFEKVIAFRDKAAGSKYQEVIAKAQTYIQKNYSDKDISLHSVAKEVNFSPNHFSTVFSQEMGETFISYVTRLRLERAKLLLKTTKMRTSDIGYEVGYNDTQYFSYVFKKNTGMTPKDFRNS
jgi:two-component system response regulator YesN